MQHDDGREGARAGRAKDEIVLPDLRLEGILTPGRRPGGADTAGDRQQTEQNDGTAHPRISPTSMERLPLVLDITREKVEQGDSTLDIPRGRQRASAIFSGWGRRSGLSPCLWGQSMA